MMAASSHIWLTFAIGFVLTSVFLLGCCAAFRINSRYNCVRAEGRLMQQGYDAEVVVHNRAAAKLSPLSADLIARLESCSISMKGAPDIEAGGDSIECIVCQEPLATKNVIMLPCGHCFHRPCIAQWLQRNATCPTCRRPLVPTNSDKTPEATNALTPASIQSSSPAALPHGASTDIEMGTTPSGVQNVDQAEILAADVGPDLELEPHVATMSTRPDVVEDLSVTDRFIRQHWQNLTAPVNGVAPVVDNRWLLYVLQPSRTEK